MLRWTKSLQKGLKKGLKGKLLKTGLKKEEKILKKGKCHFKRAQKEGLIKKKLKKLFYSKKCSKKKIY